MESIDQLKVEVQQEASKAKAEGAELAQQLETTVKGASKWKLMVVAACALCAAGYLCWSLVPTPTPKPAAFIRPAPAVTAPKVAGPRLNVPLRVVPKDAVRKALPGLTIPQGSEVVDTADIAAAPDGVQTVTFLNLSTGEATTSYTPKPAPWFALERRNTLGTGYETSTDGTRVPVYYRRDLVRVKDVHLVGEVGGKIPVGTGKLEGHAGAYAEWRF